nr:MULTISPECIES: outer membrane beta-barrel protein [unclassified Bradyrhizobium]
MSPPSTIGFYIGANGGWGSSRNNWDSVAPFLVGPEGSHDATGGVAGGQVGIAGGRAAGCSDPKRRATGPTCEASNLSTLFGPGFRNDSRIAAFGLFTGQLGWAANNVLFYVKGGAAVTDNRNRTYSTATGAQLAGTGNDSRWGGTVGAGLEYGFAPGWSAGVEYDHLFMQDRTLDFTTPASVAFGSDRIRQNVDLVTVRLNYKFGGAFTGRY